jgi:hypothetical protein
MEVSGQFHAPAALHPRERTRGTHWIGGWVGPRAVLGAVVKKKTSKASTYTEQHDTEKRQHISMPRAGLEPAIPVFEQSNSVRALDCAAIGTD